MVSLVRWNLVRSSGSLTPSFKPATFKLSKILSETVFAVHGGFPFATVCLWKNVSHSIFNQSVTRKVWRNKIFKKMKVSFTRKVWRKEIPHVNRFSLPLWSHNLISSDTNFWRSRKHTISEMMPVIWDSQTVPIESDPNSASNLWFPT